MRPRPTARFGYYTPGNTTDQDASCSPSPARPTRRASTRASIGTTTFDPGAKAFGLYTTWPGMYPQYSDRRRAARSTARTRSTASRTTRQPAQGALLPAARTADGSVVPNAYVIALEEFVNGSRATTTRTSSRSSATSHRAPAGPEIGLENLDGAPFTEPAGVQPHPDAAPDDPQRRPRHRDACALRNTGTTPLNDHRAARCPAAPTWQLVERAVAARRRSRPARSLDLTVQVRLHRPAACKTGTLTITSNDADEPATDVVQLRGFWQSQQREQPASRASRRSRDAFGYTTHAHQRRPEPQHRRQASRRSATRSSAVLAPRRPGARRSPVPPARRLPHQGNTATRSAGSPRGRATDGLFTGRRRDQSLPPARLRHGQTLGPSRPARAAFGFQIDGESSDDTRNTAGAARRQLRAPRPLLARQGRGNGRCIPNTYLVAMDYSGINYDYQDNVYLVTNVRPERPRRPGRPDRHRPRARRRRPPWRERAGGVGRGRPTSIVRVPPTGTFTRRTAPRRSPPPRSPTSPARPA